jgi:hypothetical protein
MSGSFRQASEFCSLSQKPERQEEGNVKKFVVDPTMLLKTKGA